MLATSSNIFLKVFSAGSHVNDKAGPVLEHPHNLQKMLVTQEKNMKSGCPYLRGKDPLLFQN
jgi:hypothetical protein